jgi:hypothetical protein
LAAQRVREGGGAAGRGEDCGGTGSVEQRGEEEERKGEGERLTGGAQSSAVEGKRKRGRRDWAAAVGSWWAGRPAGPKGKEGKFYFFLFLFLFQTLFKSNFSF